MSDEQERLHLGKDRKPRPKPDRPADGSVWRRLWEKQKARHKKKKARLAAMTRGRRVARRGMIAGTWFLGLIAALIVAVIIMYYQFTDVPRPEDLPLPQVATVEYSDGSVLAHIGTVDRTIVTLDQVPAQVRWAVLAAEDRGFYDEPAISIRGTVRAALSDLTGGNTQGGSGITQQYVKNAYLSDAQTLTRKLKELMIAVKLSHEYSKDQILEFYLNTVYFGRNTYGIEAAAEAFFGEDVEHLTTAQGALLAALLRAPGYYDPANNLQAAKLRWRYVLDGMVATGHLTSAQEAELTFPKTKPPRSTQLGASGWKFLLVQDVLADLDAHGIPAKEVSARGLTIRTTIDPKAQSAAVNAIKQVMAHSTKKQRNLKDALVAVDPSSGAILAYYGGTGSDRKGLDGKIDFNDYASHGGRPPGSSFKPYTLATVLDQTLHQTEGKAHYAINSEVLGSKCATIEGTHICNDPGDDAVSAPLVTIKSAMKYSLNTTFDLLASQAGPDNVAATAHAMGIATRDSYGTKTLVDKNGATSFGIGIGDYPVTPLDQAVGFATLANNGVRNDPYIVTSATASDGQVVYRHKAHPVKAISPKIANDVTLTLEPVAATNNLALANGRVSAAKTGTEGISPKSPNNSDAWMVGYTPQVSAAVWYGSGVTKPIYNSAGLPMYGANEPGKTWQLFMNAYLGNRPKLPMATFQMINSDGSTRSTAPSLSPSTQAAPSTSAPATSKHPTPSFSISSGFPSITGPVTPVTPPPVTSSSSAPPTSPSTSCAGLISLGCHTGGG